VEYEEDINKENRKGKTPLHNACRSRNKYFIRFLLNRGEDEYKAYDEFL